MTLFHLFSFLFLKSAAFSKSPPDFQLLSLAAAPDKQNLLDQADFTAAPAHMAASVAHSLSWRALFPLFTITFMFANLLSYKFLHSFNACFLEEPPVEQDSPDQVQPAATVADQNRS